MSVFYDLSNTPRNILNQAIVRAIVSESNGALFDPSDLSTLYQDAAGTTPVTAVEQPVGLMLDKSRGLMLGPELTPAVYSGTPDIAGLWTISPTAVHRNGDTNTSVRLTLGSGIVDGKSYKVTFTIANKNGDDVIIRVGGVTGDYARFANNGEVSAVLKAVGSGPVLFFAGYVGTAGTADITNISVRELYGNHATQSITASRPVLSARKNILRATETLATQSVTTFAATYTLSFTGAGSVTLSGTATGTLTGTGADRVSLTFTPTAGTLTLTISGSVTKAQVELGAVAGPYQRVTTSTDYDTDERYFKKYLRFDGVDDYLNLPYMGLYAGGAATYIMARDTIIPSSQQNYLTEASSTSTPPLYYLDFQLSGQLNQGLFIRNDAGTQVTLIGNNNGESVSTVSVKTMVDNGRNVKKYRNGTLLNSDNYVRSGTLSLSNTLIGAIGYGTPVNFAKMNLYGLILTKSALTDPQRVACERYLGRKSGVQL